MKYLHLYIFLNFIPLFAISQFEKGVIFVDTTKNLTLYTYARVIKKHIDYRREDSSFVMGFNDCYIKDYLSKNYIEEEKRLISDRVYVFFFENSIFAICDHLPKSYSDYIFSQKLSLKFIPTKERFSKYYKNKHNNNYYMQVCKIKANAFKFKICPVLFDVPSKIDVDCKDDKKVTLFLVYQYEVVECYSKKGLKVLTQTKPIK